MPHATRHEPFTHVTHHKQETTRKITAEEAHVVRLSIGRQLELGAIPNANDILAVKPDTNGQATNDDIKDFIWTRMTSVEEKNVQQGRDEVWRAVRMCACVGVRVCGSAHLCVHTHTHTHTHTHAHIHTHTQRKWDDYQKIKPMDPSNTTAMSMDINSGRIRAARETKVHTHKPTPTHTHIHTHTHTHTTTQELQLVSADDVRKVKVSAEGRAKANDVKSLKSR